MARHPHASVHASTLSDRVYSALVERARGRPGPVHALHVGDTYREPLPAARAEAQRSADHPRLHNYAPVQGEPALLDAFMARVARRTGVQLDREALQVTCGATGGLSVVASALLDPGDEVVVLSPFWPLIRGIVASRGAVPVELPFYTRLGDAGFDPEAALESVVTPRTVALYVNSPNNPTGHVLRPEVADLIARVARRHGLWVLCDEAYEELGYGEAQSGPLWTRADLADRAIVAHTLSKSYGLAGARIGFVHGPLEILRAVRGVQTFLTYCAPRPMQFGAVHALRDGDAWLEEARRDYAEAGRRAAITLGLPVPQGGTFLFFDASPYLASGQDVHAFLERCLDVGVLLTPGAASGRDYARWVRLCFTAVPPGELEDAVAKLAKVMGR